MCGGARVICTNTPSVRGAESLWVTSQMAPLSFTAQDTGNYIFDLSNLSWAVLFFHRSIFELWLNEAELNVFLYKYSIIFGWWSLK